MTNGPDDPEGKLPDEDDNSDQTRIRPNLANDDSAAAGPGASGDSGASDDSGPSGDSEAAGGSGAAGGSERPTWQPPAWQPPSYGDETAPYGSVPPPPPGPAASGEGWGRPAAGEPGSPEPQAPGPQSAGQGPGQDPYAPGASAEPPAGQDPYGQSPYGQAPYGQDPYAQAQEQPYGYGQADPAQQPYGYGATPYGYGAAPYGAVNPPSDSGATTSMILGIVGLASMVVLCGIGLVLSPFAMVMGLRAKRRIEQAAGQLGGQGQATAGFWTGLIGTIFLVLGVISLVVFFAIGLSGGFDSDPDYYYDNDYDDF
ncbi:DUF4190 domain-containing protein [Nocardioides insulae]|uniref:DUF4190 domain-containing protein n=1 Tax=Nocardioides insulae TaxID=394734 RepID=UPI000422853A|nr:DUF4190 domain-containing protein [Nocardioides insulae]